MGRPLTSGILKILALWKFCITSIVMYCMITIALVERSSSAVERRTRNQVSLGSNTPFATVSKFGHFVVSTMPQFAQLY